MTVGRVIGSLMAAAAVAGGAAVALNMSSAAAPLADGAPPSGGFSMPVVSAARPSYAPLPTLARSSSATAAPVISRSAAPTSAVAGPRTSAATTVAPTTIAPTSSAPRPATRAARPVPARTTSAPAPKPTPVAAPRAATVERGVPLPLHYSTGSATRVITVTAHSRGSTTARLQAWTKASGGGWRRYGSAVTAHIGAQGMSTHPSESRTATPIGSFTLTQAFGRNADPGTSLPYFRTRPSDWWISQSGSLYNTHQRCSSGCRFTRGDPNEHLYYETPYYNYAVVIDYNTRNAPGGVRQGAGSAFFLHVTDGSATAGCVAIPQSKLVSLMRWLTPRAHPRILIGTV